MCPLLPSLLPTPSLTNSTGDEEDHDHDGRGWKRARSALISACVFKVCSGCHSNNWIWLHPTNCHHFRMTEAQIPFSTSAWYFCASMSVAHDVCDDEYCEVLVLY